MEISFQEEEEIETDRGKEEILKLAEREGEEDERRRRRRQRKNGKSLEEKCKTVYVHHLPPIPPSSICNGCNTAIGDGIYVNAFGVFWHPQCLCCRHCHKPIAIQEISNLKRNFHKLCYKEHCRPTCYVCRNKIPSTGGGIKYNKHPFWEEMYCPSHEDDGTSKCCSCERLEAYGIKYVMLPDNRWLCLDCVKTSVMDANEGHLLQLEVRKFFERLNMKVEQEIPIFLVAKQALNKPKEEKVDNEYGVITRGICLSKEHMVTRVSNKQLKGMAKKSQKVVYECKVTAILILYGYPRLLAGCILAHEMMHAYLRLNGYRNVNTVLEEGLCQVLGHMWLVSQRYSTTTAASSSLASSSFRIPPDSTTSKKRDQSDFEKNLIEFCINQIETDESPVYGDGYRKVRKMIVSNRYNLKDTLREIERCG